MKLLNLFFKNRKHYFIIFTFVAIYISHNNVFAYVMQSSNYGIDSDSINIGGLPSTSTNYGLKDTLGELGTGDSNSSNYYMHAGYWQMQESYISISSPSDITLSAINGLTGGSSQGTIGWQVTTDNAAGYTMTVQSTTAPALKSSLDSFADYTPAGADPDYNFTNGSGASSFGFSPEGTEVISRFKDNGSACNTGSSETSAKCWDGLSTTPKTIAGSSTSNHPGGSTITVRVQSASGASHIQVSGNYTATITATATTL